MILSLYVINEWMIQRLHNKEYDNVLNNPQLLPVMWDCDVEMSWHMCWEDDHVSRVIVIWDITPTMWTCVRNIMLDRPKLRYRDFICAIGESCKDTLTYVLKPEIDEESRIAWNTLWGCQMLLRNWIVIKVVFECGLKQIARCVESRWNLSLLFF